MVLHQRIAVGLGDERQRKQKTNRPTGIFIDVHLTLTDVFMHSPFDIEQKVLMQAQCVMRFGRYTARHHDSSRRQILMKTSTHR